MPLQSADSIADVSALAAIADRTGVAQTEGNFLAHIIFSQIDADVDVWFEQSLDNTNYFGIYDSEGERLGVKCDHKQCIGNSNSHVLGVSIVGFYAPYVRAVVRKNGATAGALTIRMFV